jgi:hypothetical protein
MKIRVGIVYVLMLLLTAQGVYAGASNPPEECGRTLSKVLSSELDKAKPAAYLRNQIAQALVSERRVLFSSPIFIRAFEVALLK